ncbi:MAG TPA: dihydroorotate dehydrogenase-like protein [Chitinispirillaceae bacterium]|nr:dihydroorotate dehydrogenase-like protein [Chitinispirillaceae bacterium]
MVDLSMSYLGLKLKSPIIASSSPLCANIQNVIRMEDAGAGAVVLQSLFEEQIQKEQLMLDRGLIQGTEHFAEALSYLPDVGVYRFESSDYMDQIVKTKETVSIPVIGSLNGKSAGGWIKYAREIQKAGADALELNIYNLPTNPLISSPQVEEGYLALVKEVVNSVSIPVAIKIGPFFSSIPNIIKKFAQAGAAGVVIFNRFYQPDIDLQKLEVRPVLHLSTSEELLLRIRWAAILSGKVKIDFAITGGVHTVQDVLKCVAAGASVSMITSALLQKGIKHISALLVGISEWLEANQYESMAALCGAMGHTSVENPEAFERANYMKVLGSYQSDSILP